MNEPEEPKTPTPGEHCFIKRAKIGYPFCKWCGTVKRADGGNKPCRGIVGLSVYR